MFKKSIQVTAACLAALAMSGATAIAAEETFTADPAQIETMCEDADGRFILSWAYDDKGTQWGRLYICDAPEFKVTCQDNLCRTRDKGTS